MREMAEMDAWIVEKSIDRTLDVDNTDPQCPNERNNWIIYYLDVDNTARNLLDRGKEQSE